MFLRNDNTIKWNHILIGIGITLIICICGILFFDIPVFKFMRGFNTQLFIAVDKIFTAKIWLVIFGIIAVAFFIKNTHFTKVKIKNPINWFSLTKIKAKIIEKSKGNYAFFIFCAIFMSVVITGALKFGIGRMRPIFYETLGRTGFYPGTNDWAFNSMPSGHTTASFAGLVMIGLLFPKIKFATWMIAIFIGASRICFGAHFPSDVILGAFIGMVSADLVKSFFMRNKI